MLQLLQLLGLHRAAVHQTPVPVLAPPDRVDLGLQPGNLRVEILQCDAQNRQPIGGGALLGLHLLVALLFGQVRRLVRKAGQLGIHLGQL